MWQPGKQYVGHKQLVSGYDMWGIICITYCWNDGKPAKVIDWGYKEQDSGRVVQEFDEIIKQADLVVGKNSDKFDIKMINSVRMFSGLPGMPWWSTISDDLEKQMRRYFRLPSQSLDYISHKLGLGGKIKMEMADWINIVERTPTGEKALAKMIKYGKKDVVDTRTLWNTLSQHFDPKFNMATFTQNALSCKNCGSENIKKNGSSCKGKTRYIKWQCNTCNRYAGQSPLNATNQPGKIG